MSTGLQIYPLTGIGEVEAGADLTDVLLTALTAADQTLQSGDVLVVAQKIVSKSEGRYRDLNAVEPSARARELAEQTHKDPRLVELVLQESTTIVRACPGVLIVRHHSGCVMANAGIDASNLKPLDSRGSAVVQQVLLLPIDADASAEQLQHCLFDATGAQVGVVIADSFGRPWRNGVTNVAIGVAGVNALLDRRNEPDRAGRSLQVTEVAAGDLLASAAGLLMGEGNEGIPAVLIRGLPQRYGAGATQSVPAQSLVRPLERDLFK
ncbi:coenzyme F420-0:L-glutamate ligase [Aestuariicella hydrocarbonica]|uniref:Coenzyme F420-0:L-glutamate ligase n=1 Tax=Pseudomaricurvus hydrocarbonicus TaxID=1470433 RepID=A0A9E5MKY2_9GAMM|nr:coenzyme F420-0:L-glutamate ligase [Aestuariicella hydrocarbonica]NHO66022.1 coenzyme F420-0:L-glutamate ligase [Aestuariicella hydrocarbonica]